MSSISRSQFLRGDWGGNKPVYYPPWSRPEPAFSDTCNACGNCVAACEEKIIFLSTREYPRLDFTRGGCTFCGKCLEACEAGALLHVDGALDAPWQLKAFVNRTCLLENRTQCQRCVETCDQRAITIVPGLGGRSKLHMDVQSCSGCGMCIATCPVGAIALQHRLDRTHQPTYREKTYG